MPFSWPRLLLSGLVALTLMPSTAAAAVQGIGLSPTSQDISLDNGGTYNGSLTVINDGDNDVTYKIYATDYQVHDDMYVGDFSTPAARANVSTVSWFTLPKGTFTAKARVQSKFNYTITVPETAAVGGHYGAIFIETVPPPGAGGAFVSRVERIGCLFYLTVKGDVHRDGYVADLSGPFLQWTPPVQSTLRMSNTGNVHYLTEGTAQLSTIFGPVGKAVPFKGEVLPETTRRFDLKLPSTAPIALYKVTATVHYLSRTEIDSHWVLLMPQLTFVILSSTLVLLLGLVIWLIVKRIRRRR